MYIYKTEILTVITKWFLDKANAPLSRRMRPFPTSCFISISL